MYVGTYVCVVCMLFSVVLCYDLYVCVGLTKKRAFPPPTTTVFFKPCPNPKYSVQNAVVGTRVLVESRALLIADTQVSQPSKSDGSTEGSPPQKGDHPPVNVLQSKVLSFHVNPGFPILSFSLLQEVDLELHNDSTNQSILAPDGRGFPCCGVLLRNPRLESSATLSFSSEAFLEGTPVLDTLSQGFFQVRVLEVWR